MTDRTARIGALKLALEQVEETSTARTSEIAAVLRLAQGALLDGSGSDAAAGIGAALRMLADMQGALRSVVNEVHPCGPS